MSLENALAERLTAELSLVRPREGAWADLRAALEADPPVPLWYRVWDRGLSRRQFLRAAAATAGALALPGLPLSLPAGAGPAAAGAAPAGPATRTARFVPGPPPRQPLPHFAPPDGPSVYLPGLGFTADRAAVASVRPVSVAAGGMKLTVNHLAYVEGAVWVDAELAGLSSAAGPMGPYHPDLESASLAVRTGGGPALAEAAWFTQMGGLDHAGGLTSWTRVVLKGVRLRPGEAEVALSGPELPEGLTVAIPLLPSDRVGLPAGRLAGASATVRGLTLAVADAALGTDPTVLRLAVSGPPEPWLAQIGARFGRTYAGPGRASTPSDRVVVHELVLRDAEGREYLEEPSLHPIRHDRHLLDDVVHFPRVPADAEGLELVVPAVTLHGMQAECQLEVPVADLRPGSKRPVELTCALGPFPVRAGQVELVERDDGLFVALDVDLGPVVDGRLLVRPGVVLVDGVDRGLTLHWAATRRERAEVIEVPLPPSPGASVVLTLQSPVVELQGPWVIPL